MNINSKGVFCRVEIDEVEIDKLDHKLNQTAARKRIPSLTVNEILEPEGKEDHRKAEEERSARELRPETAPRKTISLEVPDYLWVALKTTAAQKMITMRHLVLSALIENGFEIRDVDMVEDGRRLR